MAGGFTTGQPQQERLPVITLGFNLSNYNGVNVSCAGSVDGSIDLTPSSGIPPYTFIWSTGATTEDITGLTAGTYTVTVTDFSGDTETGTVTLNAPAPLNTVLVNTLPDSCGGIGNGSININTSGGVPGYDWQWNNGSITEDVGTLVAGGYTVKATDLNGCTVVGAYTVSQVPAMQLTPIVSNVNCSGGTDGSIDLTVFSGNPAYTYAWSNGATVQDISGIGAGSYTVTVTDAAACSISSSFTVVQPATLPGVAVNSSTNILCNGQATGEVNITASGGTPGYSYLWSTGSTLEDISGLTAGTYTVTVTDANACTVQTNATVTQPAALVLTTVVTNVACNGAATGVINLTVSGGTAGYSFVWSTGSTLEDISGLAAGTYTITVTDANGCTASLNRTLTQNAALDLSSTVTNINCNGLLTGAVNLTVSGGVSGYSYNWSNGTTSEDLVGVGAAVYTVTVTDAVLCTATRTVTVAQPASLSLSTSFTAVSCNGGSSGSIDLTVAGGTAGYTYLWNNGTTTQDRSGLTAGTYTVTVSDANGCTAGTSVTVSQPAALSLFTSVTNVACSGGNNGAINLTVSGGTAGYAYSWSNGSTTEDVSGLAAGTYTVTVTDALNCTATTNATVSQSGSLSINFFPVNGTCNAANGTVTALVSGGTPAYNYLWSTGAATPVLSGLAAGTYTLTVTDAALCTITNSLTIGNSGSPQPAANQLASVSCNGGSNGAVDINVTSGTPGYTYLWSTGAITQDISGVPAGTYTVTVTDVNFCVGIQSFVVTQPLVVDGAAAVSGAVCNGGASGSIDLTPSGGTPGYTYLWSNGSVTQDQAGLLAGSYTVTITDANACIAVRTFIVTQPTAVAVTTSSTSTGCLLSTGSAVAVASGGTPGYSYLWSSGGTNATINGLAAGIYTVTVTDANGCTAVGQTTVVSSNGPVISSAQVTNVTCNSGVNGGIDITVNGGTPGYSYNWSNSIVSQDLTGLTAGSYTVTVTDANNCTVTAQYQVSEPLVLAASFSQTPASCSLSNGSVIVTATGGTPGYTYLWSTGSTGNPLTNIPAAVYTVTVTDQQGCTGAFVSAVSGTAATVIDSSRVENAVCNATATGGITLFLSGGAPPLTFLWSTGATSQNLTGLTNGNYTVTITNGSGCTLTRSFVVTQPTFLSAVTSTLPSFCGQATGSATVTAGGGTPGYSYLWSNGGTTPVISSLNAGTYTVTVTDANGCTRRRNAVVSLSNGPVISLTSLANVTCNGGAGGAVDIAVTGGTSPYVYNWSNGAVTQDISSLSAGTYTVVVTDSALCSDSLSFTVTQPDSFSVNPNISAAACGLFNGSIAVVVSGGTPAYTYQWSTGATTNTIIGLSSATYTLTLTDAAGCNKNYFFNVGVQSGPVAVVDSVRNLRCFGVNNGRIFISVSGGSSPFSFLWNDGNTGDDRFGLAAGIYTVTVTDAGGCTAQISATVTSNSQLQPNFSTTQASCGQTNGTASAVPSGGVAPYTLIWETGSGAGTIGGLGAGFYSITITDTEGCIRNDSVAVTNSGSPLVTLQNQILPACFGGSGGSLTIGISGGIAPYTILWSNGVTSVLNNNLVAGTYAVTVTDSAGCIELASFTLFQPDALQLQFVVAPAYCGQGNGTVSAVAGGGTGQIQYQWSSGAFSPGLTGVSAGLYTLTVTDQNACTRQDTIRVLEIGGPALALDAVTAVSCFGGSNGSILVSTSGGTAPLGYSWSSGQVTPAISGVSAGIYTLLVSDSAGCTDTLTVQVNQPAELIIQSVVTDAACNNPSGAIQLTVLGGVAGYSYLWSTGATTSLIQNLTAGTYAVTVTDGNSCTIQQVIAVNNLNGPVLVPASMTPVSCPGGSDGQLDITVQFGAAPFTYLWSNGQITQDASGLSAGIYTLTVTDFNNCISIISDTVTEPAAISISAVITDASCNIANGIIVVQSTGGTPGYTFQWSTGQGSSTITGLAAGSYTVTTTDAAGCSRDTFFVVINTGVPQLILDQIDSVSCFGLADGAIDISITGGLAPYLYTWINTPQTTQDVSGLVAGSYSVIVTDNRGCTNSQLYNVNQPADIQFTFPVLQSAACGQANGLAVVQTSGGVPGYQYQWSNGTANDSISGVSAGSYTVTITDAKGCSRSGIANISNLNGPIITDVDSAGVTCYGDSDGFINITASGVSLPLTYAWSGLPFSAPTISGLSAGFYTVTVTDAAGCLLVRTINILQPDSFTINAVIPQNNPPFNISCNGRSDGALNLSVIGGSPSYAFIWSNGAVTQNLINIPAGVFTVLVTDTKGCTATRSFGLTEPPVLEANAGADVIICGENSVKLNADTPAFGIGTWQVVTSSGVILFSNASSPVSEVSGIGEGDNVLRWIISNGTCSDTDLVVITKTSAIDAIVGVTRRVCGEAVTLNATRPEFGFGYWTALNPQVTLEDSSKAFTDAYGLEYGSNQFIWTVVNGSCRDSALLTVFRKDTLDCLEKIKMPTAFSPNFDGFNDFLIIKGLEDFPDNTIELYNRWGQLVFSKEGYRNDWYGLDPEGVPLPDGTYFVILKVRFINRVFNSYIDMRR